MTAASGKIAGVKVHAPTTVVLYRARLIFTLTALIPTVLITALGIIFLAAGGSKSVAVVGGILVLAFCATALGGLRRSGRSSSPAAPSLAAVQNEFLSSVSHELRTPLTSIRMFIDTLREDRVTDSAETAALPGDHHQELDRLDGLVGKLIELSKIESRRDAFERRPVAVADIVDDALATFEDDAISAPTSRVDVQLEHGLVVRGDRGGAGPGGRQPAEQRLEVHASDGKRIDVSAAGRPPSTSTSR